jgi:HK97 family phage major capsid protein
MDLKKSLADAKKVLEAKKAERLAASQKSAPKTTVKGAMPELLKKTLNSFGVKSLNEVIAVNTADRKFAYLSKEEKEKVKMLKEGVDTAILISKLFKIPVKETKFFKEELSFTLKAFGIGAGDNGFEWIPTVVSDSYIDEFNLERKVSGLFTEVKMPSNPYKWPVLSAGAIARRTGVATAINKQTFKTDKTIQFDAEKLASRYELPEELSEDSAPDVIKAIRQELMEGQEKALEIAILEGDTAGAMHEFSQLPDVVGGTTIASIIAETPETAFDGIRVRLIAATLALSSVDSGGNAVSETEISAARGKMGKFGVDPSQCVLIAGPKVYNQMILLDDVRTIEQYGGQATVLTGELAKYEGMPVIVSEYLREDLDATGVNSATPANNIKGSLIIVNRKRWFLGLRRAIQVKVENNKTELDVLDLVAFSRRAFQAVLKADGSNYAVESTAAMVYNIGF